MYELFDLIDEIYDDFESRVCRNCKHFNLIKEDFREGILDVWVS